LSTSTPCPWRSIFCRPWRVLKRLNHCHEALKSESEMDNVEAILFAFTMARDGGTGSLARRMLSIQMYNISSSLVNRPTEALKVFCLVSSESKADRSRIESRFSQTFRIAPSLTSYSHAKAFAWRVRLAQFWDDLAALGLIQALAGQFLRHCNET
jgi:hypothetical protein